MESAERAARSGARLPDALARGLGALEGTRLETRIEPGASPDVALVRPDSSPRVLVPVVVSRDGREGRSTALLRVLPLALGGGESQDPGGAPLGRWRQEWEDLTSPAPGEAAIPGLHGKGVAPTLRAPVLPPTFYCRARQVWIVAICPGCGGPEGGGVTEERCSSCGSRAPHGVGGRTSGVPPLHALWERAHGKGSTDGLDPACVSCDRRSTCYPAEGPSEAPGTAKDMLQSISPTPWGGAILEPAHLPFGAWCRLASGIPWPEVRKGLASVPPAILEESDARMRDERPLLASDTGGEPAGLESLLLRLEILRQMLEGLRTIAVGSGHPHLGVAAETVWVRLEPPGSLRTALWGMRVLFLDPAPGWRPDSGGGGTSSVRPSFLIPPGCERADESTDGLCIARAAPASSSERGSVGIDFLPHVPFIKPPAKGDAVLVGVPAPRTGAMERVLTARVEIGFPEVCRILVSDPALAPEEIRGMLTGTAVKLRLRRDHSLVDDLFAAGTLFLSSLLREAGDLPDAARFRDALAPRLQGAGGADGGETESLRAVVSSGLFAVQGAPIPLESSAQGGRDRPMMDRTLMARAVAFGMRLCAAVPGGFPCQGHEPVGRPERERAYAGLLSQLIAFAREVRQRLLATASTDDAALAALGAYALERLKDPGFRRRAGSRPRGAGSGKEPR